MQRFTDRTAIVTGGSLGIGRAIAVQLAAEGARVMITGRNAERLEQVAGEIDGDVVAVAGDVGDPDTPRAIVECAMARWGRIDVLINNAATPPKTGFLDQTKEDWDYVLAVLLTGPYFLAQQCGRRMVEQGRGSIVNIASISGHAGGGLPAYGAAKAGLINATRYMAIALGPHGVRANSVSPGWVTTPLSVARFGDALQGEFKRAPLKRMIEVQEVSAAVTFLASDEASAITGADIVVDAGVMADNYVAPTVEALSAS